MNNSYSRLHLERGGEPWKNWGQGEFNWYVLGESKPWLSVAEPEGLLKPVRAQVNPSGIPDAGHGAAGFDVFCWLYGLLWSDLFWFSSVPSVWNVKGPSIPPHIGSMWLVFDFKEAYLFRDCLESQKRCWILAFEQRWDSQRLWGLLERVQVHFVLWNINETLGVRGGMLWFKVMCLGVKLIGGEIVVVHIDCQLDKNLEPHGRQTSVWLEHGWKNDAWWTMPWGTMREALGKKAEGLFCQVNFVPRIVLGYDFMSPVTYIHI